MSARPPRIVITGFMGAGKSTVARALAERLGLRAVDLDDLITAREGRTPRALIDEEGEARFREAETRALRAALDDATACVLALGGGAWTLAPNRALVREHGCFVVWLDAPFELCWERAGRGARDERPFARERDRAARLYAERRASYQLADLHVAVGPELSADELAAHIHAQATRDGAEA